MQKEETVDAMSDIKLYYSVSPAPKLYIWEEGLKFNLLRDI